MVFIWGNLMVTSHSEQHLMFEYLQGILGIPIDMLAACCRVTEFLQATTHRAIELGSCDSLVFPIEHSDLCK